MKLTVFVRISAYDLVRFDGFCDIAGQMRRLTGSQCLPVL